MKNSILRSVLLALGLLALTLTGCSLKDKNSTGSNDNPTDTGSLNDDEYVTASQALGMSQGYTNEMILELLAGIGRIDSSSGAPALTPGPGSVYRSSEADSVSITYSAASGYWRLFTQVDDSLGGVTMTYVDSVQFRSPQGVIQWPDSTISEIRCGLILTAGVIPGSANAPDEFALDYSMALTLAGEIMTEGLILISGGGSFDMAMAMADESGSCDLNFDMATEMWQLEVDLGNLDPNACPIGGTLSSTGMMDWYCNGDGLTLDVAGDWSAMATYDNGDVVVVVESNGSQYNYTGPCDGV